MVKRSAGGSVERILKRRETEWEDEAGLDSSTALRLCVQAMDSPSPSFTPPASVFQGQHEQTYECPRCKCRFLFVIEELEASGLAPECPSCGISGMIPV